MNMIEEEQEISLEEREVTIAIVDAREMIAVVQEGMIGLIEEEIKPVLGSKEDEIIETLTEEEGIVLEDTMK